MGPAAIDWTIGADSFGPIPHGSTTEEIETILGSDYEIEPIETEEYDPNGTILDIVLTC